MSAEARNNEEVAGGSLATSPTLRIRLTRQMLRELRLQLLALGSPFSVELDLIEERYPNGDVVVRLGRPDKPTWGENILGVRNVRA